MIKKYFIILSISDAKKLILAPRSISDGRNGRLRENNVHRGECKGAHKRSPCLNFLPIADNLWSSMISPLVAARRRLVKCVWTMPKCKS